MGLEAHRLILGPGTSLVEAQARMAHIFPSTQPGWDPNIDQGKGALDDYHLALLDRITAASRKPTNLSKVMEVIQKPQESPPWVILDWLWETYWVFCLVDPNDPKAINIVFVTQSAPDLFLKLQKLEGFKKINRSQLLDWRLPKRSSTIETPVPPPKKGYGCCLLGDCEKKAISAPIKIEVRKKASVPITRKRETGRINTPTESREPGTRF